MLCIVFIYHWVFIKIVEEGVVGKKVWEAVQRQRSQVIYVNVTVHFLEGNHIIMLFISNYRKRLRRRIVFYLLKVIVLNLVLYFLFLPSLICIIKFCDLQYRKLLPNQGKCQEYIHFCLTEFKIRSNNSVAAILVFDLNLKI